MEEPSDRIGADGDAEIGQRQSDLVGRSPGPFQPGDRVAGGVVFQQELDQENDVGGFFSSRLRPPPP